MFSVVEFVCELTKRYGSDVKKVIPLWAVLHPLAYLWMPNGCDNAAITGHVCGDCYTMDIADEAVWFIRIQINTSGKS